MSKSGTILRRGDVGFKMKMFAAVAALFGTSHPASAADSINFGVQPATMPIWWFDPHICLPVRDPL
jgi:hypothetical protein